MHVRGLATGEPRDDAAEMRVDMVVPIPSLDFRQTSDLYPNRVKRISACWGDGVARACATSQPCDEKEKCRPQHRGNGQSPSAALQHELCHG